MFLFLFNPKGHHDGGGCQTAHFEFLREAKRQTIPNGKSHVSCIYTLEMRTMQTKVISKQKVEPEPPSLGHLKWSNAPSHRARQEAQRHSLLQSLHQESLMAGSPKWREMWARDEWISLGEGGGTFWGLQQYETYFRVAIEHDTGSDSGCGPTSCTSWQVEHPGIFGFSSIPTGAKIRAASTCPMPLWGIMYCASGLIL